MIRCIFKANEGDYRPVKWLDFMHPYWCSGDGEGYSIVVAYADNEEQVLDLWPEATDLDSEEAEEYMFTSRFPKPRWFNEIKR